MKESELKLTRQIFEELKDSLCDHWIAKAQQEKFDSLNPEEQCGFSPEEFENAMVEELFQKFEYILVDNSNKFDGVSKNQKTFIQECEGAWAEISEFNLKQ